MTTLPNTEHVRLDRNGPVLWVWLDRPDARNALSAPMTSSLMATFQAIRDDRTIRVVVIRGANGIFCSGGDLKSMNASGVAPAPGTPDPLKESNRRFGRLLDKIDAAPQVVIAAVEGPAFGGALGIVCVADVAIARADAQFSISETTLGIVPAAISPFLVARVGLTLARRLAVTAARFDGAAAAGFGLVSAAEGDPARFESLLRETINAVLRCAPEAVAETKRLLHRAAGGMPRSQMLDLAAESFAAAVRGAEGREGTSAFIEKRKPAWVAKV
jgi:isohexenylglutaconyl-CoA hydratase